MGLTQTKEFHLARMNNEAQAKHSEETEKNRKLGKAAPPPFVPLTAEQIEWPKWVHKGWKATGKTPGHFEPAESKLVHSEEQLKELGGDWTDSPPKSAPEAKKEVPVSKKG